MSQFTALLDDLAREAAQRRPAREIFLPRCRIVDPAPTAPKPTMALKALPAAIKEAELEQAQTAVNGFRPGHGCRIPGIPDPCRVAAIDPAYGRVGIRKIENLPKYPGFEWEESPLVWVAAGRLDRAPEHDDPGMAGQTFAKSLAESDQRRAGATALLANKARARAIAAQAREVLTKALADRSMTAAEICLAEAKLVRACERLGI